MQMAVKAKFFAQGNRVRARGIGQHDSQTRQAGQAIRHTAMARADLLKPLKLMGIGQKMVRIGFVVPHHAQQGGTVLQPVAGAQFAGLLRINNKVLGQVPGHLLVDLGQNMGRRVVQGVVQIKQVHLARQARMGTTNITNTQNE